MHDPLYLFFRNIVFFKSQTFVRKINFFLRILHSFCIFGEYHLDPRWVELCNGALLNIHLVFSPVGFAVFFCPIGWNCVMVPYWIYILCPFAVHYLRYAVRSFFTMSRISLADDKKAGQKVQRKIAVAVQKVKSPLLFVPLFWNQWNKLSTIILLVLVIKLTKERRRRVSRGRD